jgi:hypothetical protein
MFLLERPRAFLAIGIRMVREVSDPLSGIDIGIATTEVTRLSVVKREKSERVRAIL